MFQPSALRKRPKGMSSWRGPAWKLELKVATDFGQPSKIWSSLIFDDWPGGAPVPPWDNFIPHEFCAVRDGFMFLLCWTIVQDRVSCQPYPSYPFIIIHLHSSPFTPVLLPGCCSHLLPQFRGHQPMSRHLIQVAQTPPAARCRPIGLREKEGPPLCRPFFLRSEAKIIDEQRVQKGRAIKPIKMHKNAIKNEKVASK